MKHLHVLRDRLGDRLTAVVVVYLGNRVVPFGQRIWALPVSALWADLTAINAGIARPPDTLAHQWTVHT